MSVDLILRIRHGRNIYKNFYYEQKAKSLKLQG